MFIFTRHIFLTSQWVDWWIWVPQTCGYHRPWQKQLNWMMVEKGWDEVECCWTTPTEIWMLTESTWTDDKSRAHYLLTRTSVVGDRFFPFRYSALWYRCYCCCMAMQISQTPSLRVCGCVCATEGVVLRPWCAALSFRERSHRQPPQEALAPPSWNNPPIPPPFPFSDLTQQAEAVRLVIRQEREIRHKKWS